MVDDLVETFQTDTALSDVSIEQPDSDHNVRELAKLSNLLWCGQRNEWSQTGPGQDGFKSSGNLTLNRVRDGCRQLNVGVLSNDVLLVFVEKVVEDLLVEQRNAFEIVA